MAKFVDAKNRIWIVDVTGTTIRRVKTLTGKSLLDVVDKDLIAELTNDFLLLSEVLYAVCKPQADLEEIGQDEFESGLIGDVLSDGLNTLVDAILTFLPEPRRRLIQKAIERYREVTARGMERIESQVSDPAMMDRVMTMMDEQLPTLEDCVRESLRASGLSDSVSNSLASSASTPVR